MKSRVVSDEKIAMTRGVVAFSVRRSARLTAASIALLLMTPAANCGVLVVDARKIVSSIAKDLPYDDEGKLSTHTILYSGPSSCGMDGFDPPYAFEMHEVRGDALNDVFGSNSGGAADDDVSSCRAVCLERGTDQSVAGSAMPHKHYVAEEGNSNRNTFAAWVSDSCVKVDVCLMNYHSRDNRVNVFWIPDDDRPRVLHVDIGYGVRGTECFKSYIGHGFEAQDGATGEVLGRITVEYTLVMGFGESPPSDETTNHPNIEVEVERDLRNEWRKQGEVKRSFSPLGFKRGKLPPDVFASMGAFYYNNRGNKHLEEWKGKGVFVNWWESRVYLLQAPNALKSIWQIRLLELVEAWAGIQIEQTIMYGLRQYERGARLLTHVDRQATHAVSLIVNVAQGNLTEPWPVEIYDHAGRLHEIIMEPGDIVYYESAKCLHGRNRPMMGDDAYYVNLFTHYRPVDDADEWFIKPNHPGTPEPVLETVGECRLEPIGYTGTSHNSLGIVQGVKCDDDRLGEYLSPSLYTASSAADLIEWWRRTAPPGAIGGAAPIPDEPVRDEL